MSIVELALNILYILKLIFDERQGKLRQRKVWYVRKDDKSRALSFV